MEIVQSLIAFFKKSNDETKNETPDGICPNCWGSQEYDNKIRKLYKDKQIDVNNKDANHAFIQNFVVNQLDGITLKKGNDGLQCNACSTID
jgi:hypothetical protein